MSRLHHVINPAHSPAAEQRLIVFLPGLFAQGAAFASIARGLSDCATTVQVDLLNHGKSPWTENFDYLDQAAAVAELLAELAHPDQEVILVGHSMGGKVAMLTALLHPELVDRLAVLDMTASSSSDTTDFRRNAELLMGIDLASLTSRQDADDILATEIDDELVRGFLLQNLQRDSEATSGWSWKANLQLIADQHPQVASWPSQADGQSFASPTLLVGGANSDYVTEAELPKMRELFPQLRVEMLADTGHWVHAERPAEISAMIRELADCS